MQREEEQVTFKAIRVELVGHSLFSLFLHINEAHETLDEEALAEKS